MQAEQSKRPLLEVRDLRTRFFTQDGVVKAVNSVSFSLNEGEALGLVGESGCGKSVSALSLMRLIPQPPGKIGSTSCPPCAQGWSFETPPIPSSQRCAP
jgi:ABC-type glutathione transport system ATPase component